MEHLVNTTALVSWKCSQLLLTGEKTENQAYHRYLQGLPSYYQKIPML